MLPDLGTVVHIGKLTDMKAAIFAILVFLILPPAGLLSTEYHVNPLGDDANPGTKEAPWRTIQKAA